MARRKKADDRYAWDRNARRVQTLRLGVRIFDHEGRAHVVLDLVDLAPVVDEITAADPECGARIADELLVSRPDALPMSRLLQPSDPET